MQQATQDLDHFYRFGDVYETLEACDQLDLMLGRLQRQGVLGDAEWAASRQGVAQIRERVERAMERASLLPKGPRLP